MFTLIGTIYNGFFKIEEWEGVSASFPLLVVRTNDSCSGLLWDRSRRRVLLVRQHRVAMSCEANPDGEMIELVAGRFDVKVGPKALFVKEAKEEVGAVITEDDVELLNEGRPLALSPGVLTERAYLAFVEIKESHLLPGESFGVAEEGEVTNRLWMDENEFIAGPHADLRVYTLARELETRLLKAAQSRVTS